MKGKDKSHQHIVKILQEEHKLDGWWSQMVTNSYEQHIGRHKKHERASGYEASVSKTFAIPMELGLLGWIIWLAMILSGASIL